MSSPPQPGCTGAQQPSNTPCAWSPGGRELLQRTAGDLTLLDVTRGGRVLLSHGRLRGESRGKLAGDAEERDLTYLDGTLVVGISDDGRAVLFQECAQAGGPNNSTYLKRVGDRNPIRLGEGSAVALSADGGRALARLGSTPEESRGCGSRLMLLSVGAEPPRELPRGTVDAINWAYWTRDGQRVVFRGREKESLASLYPGAAGRPAAADRPVDDGRTSQLNGDGLV